MTTDDAQSQIEYDAPFAKLLDMRPGLSTGGVGTAIMTVQDKHRQAAGVVQGGIIVTLADYAFFRAVRSILQPGRCDEKTLQSWFTLFNSDYTLFRDAQTLAQRTDHLRGS